MKIFGRYIRTAVFTCATVLISSVVSAAGWVHVAPAGNKTELIESINSNICANILRLNAATMYF